MEQCTTSLSVTQNFGMIVFGECEADESFEEYALQQKLSEVSITLRDLEEFCLEVKKELCQHDVDLHREVMELFATLQELQGENDTDFNTDEDGELEEDIDEEADDTAGEKFSEREYLKQCKYAYKSIANICHPDRTTNKHLHALFLAAVTANAEGDLEELLDILDIARSSSSKIKSVRTRARTKIADRIQRLKNQIEKAEKEVEAIITDPEFIMIEVYKTNGKEDSIKLRKRLLLSSRDQLKSQIMMLSGTF